MGTTSEIGRIGPDIPAVPGGRLGGGVRATPLRTLSCSGQHFSTFPPRPTHFFCSYWQTMHKQAAVACFLYAHLFTRFPYEQEYVIVREEMNSAFMSGLVLIYANCTFNYFCFGALTIKLLILLLFIARNVNRPVMKFNVNIGNSS